MDAEELGEGRIMAILLAAHEYADYIALMHIGKRYCDFEDGGVMNYDPTKEYYHIIWRGDCPCILRADVDIISADDIEDLWANDIDLPMKAAVYERKKLLIELDSLIKHCLRTSPS